MELRQERLHLLFLCLYLFLLLLSLLPTLLYSLNYLLSFSQIFHLQSLVHLVLSFSLVLRIPRLSFLSSLLQQSPLLMHVSHIVSCYFGLLRIKRKISCIHAFSYAFVELIVQTFFDCRWSLPAFYSLEVRHFLV